MSLSNPFKLANLFFIVHIGMTIEFSDLLDIGLTDMDYVFERMRTSIQWLCLAEVIKM